MLQANSLAIIVLVVPGASLGRAIGLQGAAQARRPRPRAVGRRAPPGRRRVAAGSSSSTCPSGCSARWPRWPSCPAAENLAPRSAFDGGPGPLLPGRRGPAHRHLLRGHAWGGAPPSSSAPSPRPSAARWRSSCATSGRTRHPMLDLGLFARRRFSAGIASGMGSYLVMFGVLLLVPFYLTRGRHQVITEGSICSGSCSCFQFRKKSLLNW